MCPRNLLFVELAPNPHFRQRYLSCLLFLLCLLPTTLFAQTQTTPNTTKPYATLDRQSVTYRGPVPSAQDSSATTVIGVLLPLSGAQQTEGKALLAAAKIALQQENDAGGLPGAKQLELAARDESGPWGQASMEILKLYDQDHAVAVVTSANGASAHLAEQIANKISIPILTLASDPSTTQANVPWLFRLGPSDTYQAQAFCQRIYRDLGLKQVLLIVQMDHDGRVGAAAFENTAKSFHAAPPQRFEWSTTTPNPESFQATLQANPPDAIVIWSDSAAAATIAPLLQSKLPATPLFLCRKATQADAPPTTAREGFTVDSVTAQDADQRKFQQAYLAQTGTHPTPAAYQIARAIHVIAEGLRANGTNRFLLRDYLANQHRPLASEVTNPATFDAAGNDLQPFALVKLPPAKP